MVPDSPSDSFKRLFKRQEESPVPHPALPAGGQNGSGVAAGGPGQPQTDSAKPLRTPSVRDIHTDAGVGKAKPPIRVIRIETANASQDKNASAEPGTKAPICRPGGTEIPNLKKTTEIFQKVQQETSTLEEKQAALGEYLQDMGGRLIEQRDLLQKLIDECQILEQRIRVKSAERETLAKSIQNLTEIALPQQEEQLKKIIAEITQGQTEAQKRQLVLTNLLGEIPQQKELLNSLQAKEAELKKAYEEAKNQWSKLTEILWQLERDINQKNSESQRLKSGILHGENSLDQYAQLIERTRTSVRLTDAEIIQRQQDLIRLKGYAPSESSFVTGQKSLITFKTKQMELIFWITLALFAAGLVGITIWQALARIL